MSFRKDFTAQELRRILRYESKTGRWFWLAPYNKKLLKKGDETALPDKLLICKICIKGVQYASSRLAWLYMTGQWPKSLVDHIDGDISNNRWKNLRQASFQQNSGNRKLNKNSKTGFKGVTLEGKKFRASCRREYLGRFDTAEQAHAAYATAAKKHFGEFARVR